jgi:ribonucleoside-diphosphate reductase beta chain
MEDKGDVKANFFEATLTSYNQSSAIDGWDF